MTSQPSVEVPNGLLQLYVAIIQEQLAIARAMRAVGYSLSVDLCTNSRANLVDALLFC